MTAPARQARHAALTASLRLGAARRGESIKALSEYLGHHDPGFTLRTYTNLMPNSAERTRCAIEGVFGDPEDADGPDTAQSGETGL